MKLLKTRHGIYMPAFLLLTALAVLLRTVALLLGYDPVTGYYLDRTLGQIADISAAVGVLLLMTYAIPHRKDKGAPIDTLSPAAYIPAGIAAAALPFLARHLITVTEQKNVALTVKVSALLAAVLALPAAVFFLLTVLLDKKESRLRAELGMLSALCLAAYAAYLYFNTDLPINAPSKLTEQCTYLAAAIFLLYETRISLGREYRPLYVSFAFVTAHLTAYTSLPALLLYFLRGTAPTESLPALVLTFALFLLLLARLILTGKRDEAASTPLTEVLIADAMRTEAALRDKPPLPFDQAKAEEDAPQESTEQSVPTLPADFFAEVDPPEADEAESTAWGQGKEETEEAPSAQDSEEEKGEDA